MKIAALQSTDTVRSSDVTEGRVTLTQRRLLFQLSWQRRTQLGPPSFPEESEWSLSEPSFLRLPAQPAGSAPPPGVTQHQPVGSGESSSKYWTTTQRHKHCPKGTLIRSLLLHKILWLTNCDDLNPHGEQAVHMGQTTHLWSHRKAVVDRGFEQGNLSPNSLF